MTNSKGPTPSTSFKPEIPRRVVDIPGTPRPRLPGAPDPVPVPVPSSSSSSSPPRDSGRKLIVGRDISLAGEINSCDHLIVEGRIEARLKDCRTIEIADTGVFKGAAEIDEADIGGRFEGDLTVRGRLRVRGTGVLTGSVRYGELEVEVGGRLIGTLDPLDNTGAPVLEFAAAQARDEID